MQQMVKINGLHIILYNHWQKRIRVSNGRENYGSGNVVIIWKGLTGMNFEWMQQKCLIGKVANINDGNLIYHLAFSFVLQIFN
jgi:hypothetical protein